MPNLVRSVEEMRSIVSQWHAEGSTVAIVPTMGALHEGHLTLVREGFNHADKVIVTIFVNPKQFAAHEDLGKYPRTEEQDLELLATVNADLVYAPAPTAMYEQDFATTVQMQGPAHALVLKINSVHIFLMASPRSLQNYSSSQMLMSPCLVKRITSN